MNLYIIILKGVLCFFLPTVEKLRTQKLQKKKISFQKRDQNRISVFVLQKVKKKRAKTRAKGKKTEKKRG